MRRLEVTVRRLVRREARQGLIKVLSKVRPEDVAVLLRGLTPAEQLRVFGILMKDFPDAVVDVLTEVSPNQRLELMGRLTPDQIGAIVERAPVDDAVFLIESLPSELRDRVLDLVDVKDLKEVRSQLTYEDDTAGRIMDTGYFAVSEETTVGEAIAALREQQEVEMIFYLYVIDDVGHLRGVTSLRQLLLRRPERTLGEIMQSDLIKVSTDTDQEVVAQLAARYDLLAIPVTDDSNRLVGIVTVDDIVDVVREEATEDFYKMVGTSDDELQYSERSWKVAGIRLPWLLVNLVGLLLTGVLLQHFQSIHAEALFLLAFVPAIMGMAGNSGTQTSTITVRGIATGRLAASSGRVRHFVWQQLKVGLLLGLITGLTVTGVAIGLHGNPIFGAVVGGALFLAIVLASLSGTLIPLLFQRLNIDPAVAAGPMVTTSSDIMGILVYFGLVSLLITFLVP